MTTPRLQRYIEGRFSTGTGEEVLRLLAELGNPSSRQSEERIQTAIVLAAGGSWEGFRTTLDLAHTDWRDALIAGGLENDGWSELLDELLGSG